jgi:hypothetical protein
MLSVNPIYVLLGGIAVLILLLHERARFLAALIVFVVVAIAAAQVFGVDLRFRK